MWLAERRGTCIFLAALGGWDGYLCRRAALELGELTDAAVVRLLLDASLERG